MCKFLHVQRNKSSQHEVLGRAAVVQTGIPKKCHDTKIVDQILQGPKQASPELGGRASDCGHKHTRRCTCSQEFHRLSKGQLVETS